MRRDTSHSTTGPGTAEPVLWPRSVGLAAGAGRRAMTVFIVIEVLAAAGLLAGRLVSAPRSNGVAAAPASAPAASARSQSRGASTPASSLPVGSPRPRQPLAAALPVGVAGSAPSGPVSCDTDLPLSASPAAGYNFLCRQGGIPVTWSTSRLTLYVELSAGQRVAFDQAVGQWAAAARFQLDYVSAPQDADVTVTDAALADGQPGFVEDGYTTVSYRCTPVCVYSGAQVELSTTAALSRTDWVATILHELGHVAGLNHVSMTGEVMYPYLTASPPQTYTAGDLEGLLVLAAERGA